MYIITTDVDYIIVTSGMQKTSLLKSKISGVNVVQGSEPKIILLLDSGSSPFTMDYDEGMTVNGVTQTTLAMAEASIKAEVRVGIMEFYIAGVGQTAFPLTFLASATNVRIYESGTRNFALTGWTFPAGVPTFAAGMLGGELIGFERMN